MHTAYRLLHGASYAQQNEYPEKNGNDPDESEDRSQKSLDKIHNVLFYYLSCSFRVGFSFLKYKDILRKTVIYRFR